MVVAVEDIVLSFETNLNRTDLLIYVAPQHLISTPLVVSKNVLEFLLR
jgi:hypothetical protein